MQSGYQICIGAVRVHDADVRSVSTGAAGNRADCLCRSEDLRPSLSRSASVLSKDQLATQLS